jgi:O-antigen/teichoic acid export membrane protein
VSADRSHDPNAGGARLSGAEVRRRAGAGAVLLGARGLAIRGLGLGTNIVLARLLLPADFGVVALGSSLLTAGIFLSDIGLGAPLIRRPDPPERADLAAVVGVQLILMVLIAGLTAAIAAPLGEDGTVVAAMVAALPIVAFRTPGFVTFERTLTYGPLVKVEVAEAVAYAAVAITTVAAGLGLWGLAAAAFARTVTSSGVTVATSSVGLVMPRLAWSRVRPLIAFGARFQAIGILNVVRDQGLNFGLAAAGGLTVLGLWSLAFRLLQVPGWLCESLYRVSYPAMARLSETDEEPGPLIERATGMVAIAVAAILVVLVGSAPGLVPLVFGAPWADAANALPGAAVAYVVGAPISIATAGYLYAADRADTVLRAAVLHTLALGIVTFSLLPLIGVAAVGLGVGASGLVEAVMLGGAAARATGARVWQTVALPSVAAALSGAAGWALADASTDRVEGAALGGGVALALFVTLLATLDRTRLRGIVSLVRRSVGDVASPGTAEAVRADPAP